MNFAQKIFAFAFFIFPLVAAPYLTHAQFEGKIAYARFNIDQETKTKTRTGSMKMIITDQRILLQDLANISDVSIMGTGSTSSILIRQDKRDFVIMNGRTEALKMTQQDLQSMSGFLKGFETSTGPKEGSLTMKSTEVTDNIKGYKARKYIIENGENPLTQIELWLTDEVKVNWGMLTERWLEESGTLFASGFVFEHLFKKNALPLLLQVYHNNTLVDQLEATSVSEEAVSPELVEIPSGLRVMSLQQFMMKRMSGN